MTKAELVASIAEKSGLNKNQAKDALEAVIDSITDAMKSGTEVRIVGFGNFVPVDRPEGVARNPRTGEQVKRPASKTVKFRPGEGLKGALN
ncbi:MAG: HU family DNA-binding protein [Caulobacteraceae bacterium]|jgi:DNA-binding protein HU-beta